MIPYRDKDLRQEVILEAWKGSNIRLIERELQRLETQINFFSKRVNDLGEASRRDLELASAWRYAAICGSILLGVILALTLSRVLNKQLIQPLQRVSDAAEQIIKSEDFSTQILVQGKDEVGQLSRSFNQLIQWVSNYIQVLESTRNRQVELVQNEKMNGLRQVVAGIAHEINNPVSFIQGNLGHLRSLFAELLEAIHLYQLHYPDPNPKLEKSLEELDLDFVYEDLPALFQSMETGSFRIRDIVVSLRNFSRLDESEFKQANINDAIHSTLSISKGWLASHPQAVNILLIEDYGDVPLIELNVAQFNQAILNVVTNSLEVLSERKVLSDHNHQSLGIATSIREEASLAVVQADQVWVRITTRFQEQWESIVVEIVDNGPGIDKAHQARIFDPFFTTKPIGEGTGLGLSIAYQAIVEKNGGGLEYFDNDPTGAGFRIILPLKPMGEDLKHETANWS